MILEFEMRFQQYVGGVKYYGIGSLMSPVSK